MTRARHRRRWRPALPLFVLVAAAMLTGWSATAAAQAQPTYDESRVKAAFLVRFGQFVEWPAQAFRDTGGALVIGVINDDPVLAALRELASNRSATGRALSVHALKSGSDLAHVHMLFIGVDEKARMAQHVASVAGRPVLLVTEWEEAIKQGAVINFLLIERRVRFEIALNIAEKAGLVVSSRLLSVAARVYRGELRHPVMLAYFR